MKICCYRPLSYRTNIRYGTITQRSHYPSKFKCWILITLTWKKNRLKKMNILTSSINLCDVQKITSWSGFNKAFEIFKHSVVIFLEITCEVDEAVIIILLYF